MTPITSATTVTTSLHYLSLLSVLISTTEIILGRATSMIVDATTIIIEVAETVDVAIQGDNSASLQRGNT